MYIYLSYTKTATSQAAKESFAESMLFTLSSGISLKMRNFLLPCQKRLEYKDNHIGIYILFLCSLYYFSFFRKQFKEYNILFNHVAKTYE